MSHWTALATKVFAMLLLGVDEETTACAASSSFIEQRI